MGIRSSLTPTHCNLRIYTQIKQSLSGARDVGLLSPRERPELAKTTVSPICISIDHAPLYYPYSTVRLRTTTVGAHRGAWRLSNHGANGFFFNLQQQINYHRQRNWRFGHRAIRTNKRIREVSIEPSLFTIHYLAMSLS